MTSELALSGLTDTTAPIFLVTAGTDELIVPLLVASEGDRAVPCYVEFLTAQIRNSNTRAAYTRAAGRFLAWCEAVGLVLPAIGPVHIVAHVEQFGREINAPSVKQQFHRAGEARSQQSKPSHWFGRFLQRIEFTRSYDEPISC